MKKKKYYQQELANAEAELMYLRVDINKLTGKEDKVKTRDLLGRQANLEARIEDLQELVK